MGTVNIPGPEVLYPELIAELIKKAEGSADCWEGYHEGVWSPGEVGNEDDVFWIGIDEGEVLMARQVLDKLGVEYQE